MPPLPNDFEMPLNLYKTPVRHELTLTACMFRPTPSPAWQMFPKFDLKEFTATVFPIDEAEEAFKAQVSGSMSRT
jgi:(R,R)-butanediol dehydrogenase/meso-butanediol dehydrogenase/diacetyl reductase/L-iditol 2-dehydrogenase